METIWRDMRYGVRMLLRKPAFTVVAVVALGLGIGANTAIFSVVNAVMLQPLPYSDSDRLVRVYESNPSRNWLEFSASQPNYFDWVQSNRTFDSIAAQQGSVFNLTGDGEPERLSGVYASANIFDTLGVKLAYGRGFVDDDDRVGAAKVAVLSNGLWQRRFGSDLTVVGKDIRLNGENYKIIGILPAEFKLVTGTEIWVPLARDLRGSNRSNHILSVYGRLKKETTLEQATADLSAIAADLEQKYPESNANWGVRLRTVYDWMVPPQIRRSVLILLAAVGFVLLIACANVANLLLARASTRHREMAIRAALGASRLRMIRQLITESIVLSLMGGIVGVLLALWGTYLLSSNNELNVPRLGDAALDGRVLAFTVAATLLTGLVFGVVPAIKASKPDLDNALKEGGRSGIEGARHRLQRLLVVGEIALALVLLVGAGLMIRSFANLQNAPLGFDPEHVLTAEILLPTARYADDPARVDFFSRLLERVRTVPGINAAGAISQVPFSGGNWAMEVTPEGHEADSSDQMSADARAVAPDYFRTMAIPFIKGRDFTEQDRGEAPLVMIVSEGFAQRFWPNEDPIGKRFRPGVKNPFGTIVGVVGNVRNLTLEDNPRPAFYLTSGQIGSAALTLVARTDGEPEQWASAIRAQVNGLDSELPVYNLRTMSNTVSNIAGQPRFQAVLLAVFAGLAMLLAAVGVYGMMSFAVAERTHEVGVRMALGAEPRDVIRMLLWQGAKISLAGVASGVVGAFALTRLMSALLFEVSPTDALTFVATSIVLTAVALGATWIPARRATGVDPMVALRRE